MVVAGAMSLAPAGDFLLRLAGELRKRRKHAGRSGKRSNTKTPPSPRGWLPQAQRYRRESMITSFLEGARRIGLGNKMICAGLQCLSAGPTAFPAFLDERTRTRSRACRRTIFLGASCSSWSFSRAAMAWFRFLCSFL